MTFPARKPPIAIARSEHQRLLSFATALESRDPRLAETLFGELERARIVDDHRLAGSVVRMGSTVQYRAGAEVRTVTLVYPAEADIAFGRISVLTPVGAALLGLSAGQSIDWTDRNGHRHELMVLRVGSEDTARPGDRSAAAR